MRWIVATVALVLLGWWLADGEDGPVVVEETVVVAPPPTPAAAPAVAATPVVAAPVVASPVVAAPMAAPEPAPESSTRLSEPEDSPEVAYAIAENARRTIAYDSYDDELAAFYRFELELTEEELEILADATSRMAAQSSGQIVPRPEDGEAYGRFQGHIALYRAEIRAHLGDERFARVVDFQRSFTAAAADRFGVESDLTFEHF